MKRLQATGNYEILCRGYGYHQQPCDREEYPYEIRPAEPSEADAPELKRALEEFRPDVLLTFGDPWSFGWIPLVGGLAQTHWVGYYPLDAGPIPRSCLPVLQRTDTIVACARYGRDLIQAALPHKPVEVIYHGVETGVFRPLRTPEERARSGREFVVGFVGRNQPRKQIPILIKAFARFCRGKPEAFLYLHTAPRDCGWELPELLERYGIHEQSVISQRSSALCGVPDEEMNEIYNSFDVFVLPSNGEGFGMPTLDAMATGLPVIVTGCPARWSTPPPRRHTC